MTNPLAQTTGLNTCGRCGGPLWATDDGPKCMRCDKAGQQTTPGTAQVVALADAMQQLLDDMGANKHSVCPYAKAKARIAYEPFRAMMDDDGSFYMPLAEAEALVRDADNGR